MASKYDPRSSRREYLDSTYPVKQMRDTVAGPSAVKNMGELYLPMPSAWSSLDGQTPYSLPKQVQEHASNYLPWTHKNPMYRAYLQRSRFPDITANALRMCIGIALRKLPEINLPANLQYLEEQATNLGESLVSFYAFLLSEVMTCGKVAFIVDVDPATNEFFFVPYVRESFRNYKFTKLATIVEIGSASFCEEDFDEEYDEQELVKEYYIDQANEKAPVVKSREYKQSDQPENEIELQFMGKPFTKVPVFYAGSKDNSPSANNIPLIGISDISISIYQKNADLSQAHFMTCNPTLFCYGVDGSETPKVIGSNVIVGLRNPQAKAEYPNTDTSALSHIQQVIQEMFEEATAYGAALLASPAKESGEALSIREANRGASLIHCVNMVSKAIDDAIAFCVELSGGTVSEDFYFAANTEFAESQLTAQDLTALVSTWLQRGIDHDTLLDNLRDAGYIKGETTNEEIKEKINVEPPLIVEHQQEMQKQQQEQFLEGKDDDTEDKKEKDFGKEGKKAEKADDE